MKTTQAIVFFLVCVVARAVQYTWLAGSTDFDGCGASSTGDGPSARTVTQLRRCPSTPNALYLISGRAKSGVCGDVWMFNLVTLSWTHLMNHTESPFYQLEPASWCDLNDQIWLYGGYVGGYMTDSMWRFNTSTNLWSRIMDENNDVPVYRARILHNVDANGNLIMFCGSHSDVVGDLWMFRADEEKWELLYYDNNESNVDVTRPPNLMNDGILIVTGNIVTIGFGSIIYSNERYGSLWEFDMNNISWERVYSSTSRNLPAEFGVFDIINSPGSLAGALCWTYASSIYIGMGTYDSTINMVSDLWIWSISRRQWAWLADSGIQSDQGEDNEISEIGVPAPRTDAWFIESPGKDLPFAFFFGGTDKDNNFHSDLWLIDLDDGKRCEENEYFYYGNTECYSCEKGTYSYGNRTACLQCDMSTSSTVCTCSTLTYWNGSECIECPSGYYLVINMCLPCQQRILTNGSTESLCTGQVCDDGFELNQNHDECIDISKLITIRIVGITVSVVAITTTSVATIVTLLGIPEDVPATGGSDSSSSTGQFCALMGMINDWQSGLSLAFSSGFAWMMGLFKYPFITISESEFTASSSLEKFLQYNGISLESMFRVVVTSYFIIVAIDVFLFGLYSFVVRFYTDKSLESTARNFFRSLTYIWTFMFYPTTIASMVELRNSSQAGTGRQLSSIIALAIGSLMFFPFLIFGYEKEKQRRKIGQSFYSSVLKKFYAPYTDNRLPYVFIPFISKLFKCFCIVFLSGIGQVLSVTLIYCITLCLVFVINPYHSKFTKYSNVFVLILYISVCLLQCISVLLTSDGDILSLSRIALQMTLLVLVVLRKVRNVYKSIRKYHRNLGREQANSLVQ